MADKANLAWTTFGRYALLDKIGSGGMAEIYRAKTFGAAGFEKEFAVKLILPSLVDDKEFVEMFINEAKIAVSLYHANVVQVFDLGEIDTQYYIAMEFVNGMDLLDVLARCANLDLKIPLDLVLFVTMEMLKGLDFAHRAKDSYGEDLNIIHRDVSPSNVLISYAGDVKIGDFGVAKATIQRSLTESGTLKGKVGYMSPEQVVGEQIDWRSDIFSAGIVFFEAVSMSRLFIGSSDLDVMLKVRDADIEESLEKAGPLPMGLAQIVRKALAKHREERFQTAGEFYQALVDFCYQHRIKVNGSHLSNFMRRLFAEEIEAAKSRRLKDPDMSTAEALAAANVRIPARMPQLSPPRGIRVSPEASEPSEAADERYRYRDAGGLVYGPMTLETLTTLLRDRNREDGERVSIDDEEWQRLSEVSELDVPSLDVKGPRVAPVNAPSEASDLDEPSSEPAAGVLEEVSSPMIETPPAAPQASDDVRSTHQIAALKQQYAAYDGTFQKTSLARLLARLHRTSATGRLQVAFEGIEKSIYFEEGEPILVDSNREDELLGYFLLKRRVITQEELEDGLARLSEWGGRLGDALVATGAIPAHEVFTHLSEQMREKILEVFTWRNGKWGYYENQQPQTHGYPLGIDSYRTIVEGCLERIPLEQIRARYDGRTHVRLYKDLKPDMSIDELRLTSKALGVIKRFEPGDSIDALKSKNPAENEEFVMRVIYLLHQVEYFGFDDSLEANLPGD